ncbi:hypothetical protein glysoja_006997 [Glycine soja]|nr:hypothetical protein glysoja_006997 [Glycine soja]
MADARESRYSDSSFLYSLMGMTQTQKEAQDAIASVARVVPGSITDVRSFPSSNVKMIAAANNIGNLGFWNVGQSEFHLYCPHLAFISGILIQPHCFSKMHTVLSGGFGIKVEAKEEISFV